MLDTNGNRTADSLERGFAGGGTRQLSGADIVTDGEDRLTQYGGVAFEHDAPHTAQVFLREESTRTLRPTLGSYLVFCGMWVALGFFCAFVAWSRPGVGAWKGAVIAFSAALVAGLWMSGHRIRIASGTLHYRDGFFRSRSIRLSDIKSIASAWEPVITLGRDIEVPRFHVRAYDSAKSFSFNSKPFSRDALTELREAVGAALKESDTRSPADDH